MAQTYPELPPEIKKGFKLGALKYFGAGAIIASVTIGSGETLFASRGGAIFGYTLLWCFVGSAVMKGVQVYTGARHMTLTGVHPMTHWGYIPGPKNWVPWFFAILSIACFPFWLSGLPLMIGKTLNWIFGISAEDPNFLMYARFWGTGTVLVAITLTWLQTYGVLEKVQTVIVGLLLLSMLAACFASRPDWMAVVAGMVPNLPDYAPWIGEKYPKIAATPVWAEVGLYLGAIGGGTYDYLGYIGCLREKKWGLIGQEAELDGSGNLAIDLSDENVHRGRRWLVPVKVDVGIGFLCVLVFTICFMVLGAQILRPAELIPSGHALLTHQAKFLTQFHPVMKYVYQVGIFMAFFGTIYGAYEIYIRTAYECLLPVIPKVRSMNEKVFRRNVLLYCGLGGLALMWTVSDPIALVKPAAIIGGVFTCGLWCFAMIWTDRRFIPKPLRMRPFLFLLTALSGTVLTGLGFISIVDYVKDLLGG
jgi:hypothetical protein